MQKRTEKPRPTLSRTRSKSPQHLINQQVEWLKEEYSRLIRVAQAIIPESVTAAEDLTSDSVLVILRAIREGRCYISVRSRFVSYCKNLVRLKARNAYTRYTGDIKNHAAKGRLANYLRPDIRRIAPHKVEDEMDTPYERTETVE